MYKRILAALLLFVLLMSLSGCKSLSLEKLDMPNLSLFSSNSTLTAKVDTVDGQTCTICVTEADKHFDVDEQLYLTYVVVDGGTALHPGDCVRFTYSYAKNVAEKSNTPHITVQVVTLVS